MGWTYGYLVSWVIGGIVLLAMLLLRTQRRPYGLAIAMIGFGATGFLGLGLGLPMPPLLAAAGAVVGAGIGFGIGLLGRERPGRLQLDARIDPGPGGH